MQCFNPQILLKDLDMKFHFIRSQPHSRSILLTSLRFLLVHLLPFKVHCPIYLFLQRANKRRSPVRHRIITPDEDIRRLFQECVIGRGNAGLLSEALAHSKPEDLKEKDVIKVYHVRTYNQNAF